MYLFFFWERGGGGGGTVRIHWEVPQAHQKGLEIRHYISMTSYIKKDTYVIRVKHPGKTDKEKREPAAALPLFFSLSLQIIDTRRKSNRFMGLGS